MSNFPSDFNPATLLYLNPELQAYSNIVTIEEARDYYLLKGSNANIMYSLSELPTGFDTKIFVSDNKDGLNISDLNRTIKLAMSNDGYTPYDLQVFGQYQPTIYKDLRLVGTNTFAYADLGYQITDCNLAAGDDVKLVVNEVEYAFGEVITTDPLTNTFSISNFYGKTYSNNEENDTFLLYGHKIWDFERLGLVNWARNNRSCNPIFGDFSNRYYGLDPDFNVELYKLLYPDARILTPEQAILDYTARRNGSDIRIGKAQEIVSEIAFLFTDLLNLNVSCNLKCDGNFILNGYWVNGITSNSVRVSALASDSNLITEKAAKGYLDNFLNGTMVLNNLVVDSNATFCNTVGILSNLGVNGTTHLGNDAYISGNSYFLSNMFVTNDGYFGNLGVNNNATICNNLLVVKQSCLSNDVFIYGNGNVSGNFNVDGDTNISSNVNLSNSLFVGGGLQVNSNMSLSNDLSVMGNVLAYSNLTISGLVTIGTSGTMGELVLDATGSIRCDEYLLTSDERVKTDIDFLSIDQCYNVVRNAPVISYKLRYDEKKRTKYGFLAHEIEQLDPLLVSNITDFVPNVMKQLVVKNNTIKIKDHPIKNGNRLKLFCDGKLKTVSVVSVSKHSLKIDTNEYDGKKIIVYGTEITDFKTIDYTQMFAVSMGALKKLMGKVSYLENQVHELTNRLDIVGA